MKNARPAAAIAAAILAIASLSACTINIGAGSDGHMDGGGMDDQSMMDDRDSDGNGGPMMDGDLNMSDVMFVQMMIPHHEQAVEMAELAPGAGASPEVQELAAAIAAAQGPEITQMEAMLDRWGVGQMMDHSGHQMAGMVSDADMDRLRATSGASFDRLFLELMIAHHEGAIDMAQDPLANGEDPELRTLLEAIVEAQTAEIAQMQQMLAAM
jgi:uncharacterized protein (DUF305 family)